MVLDLLEGVVVTFGGGGPFGFCRLLAHQASVHLELVALLSVTGQGSSVVTILGVLLDLSFRDRCWDTGKNIRGAFQGIPFALSRRQGLVLLSLHLIEDLQVVNLLVDPAVRVLEDQLMLVSLHLSLIIIGDALGRVLQINVVHLIL